MGCCSTWRLPYLKDSELESDEQSLQIMRSIR
jgi:hypothetical protein